VSELWVPPSATEQVNFRCNCGKEFQDVRQGQRHAVRCARVNSEVVEAEAAEREKNFAPLDPEQWFWGRRRIAEGKVGFKRGQAA
jgi:hypothetical protein